MTSLVWFRQDLRLADQPALAAAVDSGPTACLYVLDDDTPGEWRVGGAQRWWLHHSLTSLQRDLKAKGGTLILRQGPAAATGAKVADEVGATSIHATRHYEPWWRAAEGELGKRVTLHDADTLVPPERLLNGSGKPFKIFGPFYRALEAQLPPAEPRSAPTRIVAPDTASSTDRLEDWHLLPTRPDWATGFSVWQPGEAGANDHLMRFAAEAGTYAERRDLPSEVGTSNLSPHLHHGEISPRAVWHALDDRAGDKFRRELAWRDFSRAVSLADPELGNREQRPLPLRHRTGPEADSDFAAWSEGRTGYPIVDAGMRQLWETGWMHNRVRLITASFLVKHLLIDWRRGAQWFWDTLVDADYANNGQNWQWIAGTGFDSQPFYRIMAPLLQSAKFGAANYIRRWVPELAEKDDVAIHEAHDPIVGHREARERALAAYAGTKA